MRPNVTDPDLLLKLTNELPDGSNKKIIILAQRESVLLGRIKEDITFQSKDGTTITYEDYIDMSPD